MFTSLIICCMLHKLLSAIWFVACPARCSNSFFGRNYIEGMESSRWTDDLGDKPSNFYSIRPTAACYGLCGQHIFDHLRNQKLIIQFIFLLHFSWVTFLYSLQPNSKVAKDNLVLVSAGRWIYAVSSIDGSISWEKEFSLDGYVLFCPFSCWVHWEYRTNLT